MKKILFVTSGLAHGGVNKSLLNLLGLFDFNKYKVDIFPLYQSGPYRKLFEEYSVISLNKIIPPFFGYDSKSGSNPLADLYIKFMIHLLPKFFFKKVGRVLSKNRYDIVVSFQEGLTTDLAAYIPAKKHIAWIHCDYSRYIANKKKSEESLYAKFDSVVAVSEYTAQGARKYLPAVADRILAIHNVMDADKIVALSQEKADLSQLNLDGFTFLSVGRLDPVKRFSYIPKIASELKEKGILFHWYIIGDGGAEKKKVLDEIEKYKVADCVVLLGEKSNPYPYFKLADIYVCLSSSEAFPNVINEAKILHTPVVSTDFPSASELIENEFNGYICPIDEIANKIEDLCCDTKKLDIFNQNTKDFAYDNQLVLKKIYDAINK